MKTITIDDQKYLTPSWEEMGNLCFELAKKVNDKKELKIDRLIALAKGGWTWARSFTDYIGIENASSLQIIFYKDVYQTADTPIITQSLPVCVSGEKVLLFDDVSDSGKTLSVAKNYLLMCGASKVYSATLFTKPWTTYNPDFYGEKTDAWIIFPHEIRETIKILNTKWSKKKVTKKEIVNRLVKIGLPQSQVTYFLNS